MAVGTLVAGPGYSMETMPANIAGRGAGVITSRAQRGGFPPQGYQPGGYQQVTQGQTPSQTGGGRSGAQLANGGTPPTGLRGAEEALRQQYLRGWGQLQDTIGQSRGDILNYGLQGIDVLNPFLQQGQGANQYAAALSGALGPEAQAQAYSNFMESPGQEWLRGQAEQGILRNAAATGGLGGGNVLKALQENAVGLASQDFNNAFNRLSGLADRGYAAGRDISGAYQGIGQGMADVGLTGGLASAGMVTRLGDLLAAGRTRAGEMLSGNIGQTSTALSNLINQGGLNIGSTVGTQGTNLANLLSGGGQQNTQILQQLASLLANISTGTGTQVAGLPGIPAVQTPDYLSGIGNILQGAGTFYDSYNRPTYQPMWGEY